MNYIKITRFDTSNGPGIRAVLWVAGCEHHCNGCHNQQTWDRLAGIMFDRDALNLLCDSLKPDYIKGLTLSGGDPLARYNRSEVLELVKFIKSKFPNKSIWCYTGYYWEEVKDLETMKYIDVLVDGKYIQKQRNITLPYCGSENQRVIDVHKSLQSNKVALWNTNPS